MNEQIKEHKLFEMFGRVSMERDLQRETILVLKKMLEEQKKDEEEKEK